MEKIVETSWFLDWSAPEELLWARLQVFSDGTAEVFDLDGRRHRFNSKVEATGWLSEDEYSLLQDMIEDGEVEPMSPPDASSDADLVHLMHVKRR